jgi:phage major capsid protein, HK97 family|nr:MAG TPA: major capsid protein [Caudoviricetes sp.]
MTLKEILNLIEEKKTQARALNSTGKVEEAKEILNEIKNLRVQEENLRELEELEKIEVLNNGTVIEDKGNIKVGKTIEKSEEEKEREIENRFLDYVKSGKVEFTNEMKESIDKDGGLIVPKDISTKINERKRELNSLKKYVRVEKVNTLTGSRVIEKNADSVPFASIEEGGLFTDVGNPEFENIEYKVVKYGGILKVTRELLEDTKENIKNYLVNWIAKKEVATENKAILTVADTIATTPVAIRTYDDIKTVLNTKIDPALLDKTVILTNQSGYNWLDTLKDKQDRYLLKDHITDPNVKALEGKYTVIVVTDKVLPVKAKKVPFYIGALDEAITHFERENRTIETNGLGSGWEYDKIDIKTRMRFDTKAFDKEALVKGEFTQA